MQGQTETPTNPPTNLAPVTFYTGKAAQLLQGENMVIPPGAAQTFDPHKQTTIPRSQGIDHSKSSPILRRAIQTNAGNGSPLARKNFENPSLSTNRQIGAPPQLRGNVSSFRQPSPAVGGVKRPAEAAVGGTLG
jgi:DNA repair and recombination protein RAD52